MAEALATRYRVILPDLRGHGESGVGEASAGEVSATMEKHAADIARVMDDANVGRAPLVGVSIGGYVLFEFWRKHRGRVAALGLCNTKAPADGPEARAGRLQAANDVLERGTEPFFESMIPKLMGKTTRETRPDLVDGALRMMRKMSPENRCASAARHGRPPRLHRNLEDHQCSHAAGDRGRRHHDRSERSRIDAAAHIANSQLRVIPKAGHYSPWEQPQDAAKILRQFLDGL